MSHSVNNMESEPVFCAFNNFLRKLHEDWLSSSSKEDMKACLQSAKAFEKVLASLNDSDKLDSFLSCVPNTFGLEKSQLLKVSDVVLSKLLSSTGVSSSCVQICIEQFMQNCGPERFENVLSSVLLCSEIYRVLLDYLASAECELNEISFQLQGQLLMQLFQHESNSQKLEDLLYEWVTSDSSERSIAVLLMVLVNSKDERSLFCLSAVLVFSRILQERLETAILFWKTFLKTPNVQVALEKYSELQKCIFRFLNTTGQWMEATNAFTWVSRESGPCKNFQFEQLVTVIKHLYEMKGEVSGLVREFLFDKSNLVGCTLWDDVQMSLYL